MAARAGSARRKGAAAAALRAGTRAGRATQVGGEWRAEQRKVHTLARSLARRPTCRAVSESQRGGARGTRAGRARARGRGRRAAAGAAPLTGASGGEPGAGNAVQAEELPASRPPPPTLPRAPPSPTPERQPRRAVSESGGRGGGFAQPLGVPPAPDCPVALPSEVPEGVRTGPGSH